MKNDEKVHVDPFSAITFTSGGIAIMIAALGEEFGYLIGISAALLMFGSIWAIFSDATLTSEKKKQTAKREFHEM